MAGKQLYFETELNNDWKRGCDAAIKVGRLRNHRKGTTERNDKKLPLWKRILGLFKFAVTGLGKQD